MLQLAVAVHFPDGYIKKLLSVWFFHGLVKVYGVWVRSGQASHGVFHVVQYLVVVLVHCLVIILIVLFRLHRTECLVQIWGFLLPDF